MPLLFSYGTLQQSDVQRALFGRRLSGTPDELPGFERGEVPIGDPKEALALGRTHYDNVVFTGRPNDRVRGTVLEVTDDELLAADRYEEPAGYRRFVATLVSGAEAFAYSCDRSNLTSR